MDLSKVEADLSAEDFDVEKHASKLLMGQTSASEISEYVACLSEAERRIDHKLEDHVSTHYKDLLDQATSIERIEDQLAAVTAQSSALLASIEKSRNRVTEPYNNIRNQTVSLGRIQETCDILRRIIRILQLGKKLQQQLAGGPADITKAAQSLSELAELWEPEKDMNLNGIQAIEGELRIFRHARTDVERSADVMLASGMETKSQNQMGVALQVYFNLNVLPTKIEQVVITQLKEIKTSLANGLDARKINANIDERKATSGGGVYTNAGSINILMAGSVLPGFRTQLWNNVENALDLIYVKSCELMQLQKVLCKKRDPSLGVSFAELLHQGKEGKSEQPQVLLCFWSETLKAIKNSLMKCAASSSSIRQTFEGEFPKLVRLFNDLWQRLCGAANTCLVSDPSITLPNPFHPQSAEDIREILTDFERVYLSRSLSRLFDPVNLMFASSSKVMRKPVANANMDNTKASNIGQAPSHEELDAVLRVITSELSIASKIHDSNNRLWTAIAKNVAKTVRLMCNKCEEAMVGGEHSGESSQVVGYPTDDQRRNVKVINSLNLFCIEVEKVANLQGENHEGRDFILTSLKDVEKISRSVLEPLMDSVKDAIEAIILTMHQETHFSENNETSVSKMSPYLRELKTFLHRVCNDFLQPFHCERLVSNCTMPLTVKTIALFVQHASMVRPLGRFGQKSLALDCEQMESVIEPLVELVLKGNNKSVEKIERSLKEVAAFKALLFTKPELVLEMPELVNGVLRYSIALHFLFNRSSPDLKSPHESAGWSVSRYSAWLEEHTQENDRLHLIQGALESYAAGARIRREKSYVAPYPAMVQILQNAIDIHCQR